MNKEELQYKVFTEKTIENPEKGFFNALTTEMCPEEQFCEWYDINKESIEIKFVTQGGSNLRTYITVFYYEKTTLQERYNENY